MASSGTPRNISGNAQLVSPEETLQRKQARLTAVLETRKPLKDDIQKLIDAHRDEEPPPFSHAELAVMAIISRDEEYSTTGQIMEWILDTFAFHKKAMVEHMLRTMYKDMFGRLDQMGCLKFLNGGFGDICRSHDAPLIANDELERGYSASVKGTRHVLQHWLEPERKGVFRFLDLAPELRNRVYHMLLVFPGPALKVIRETCSKNVELHAHGRCFEETDRKSCSASLCADECRKEDGAWRARNGYYKIHSPNKVLDIALTCKQIASETVPIFYGGNLFSIETTRTVSIFTKITTPKRLSFLKKLHIKLSFPDKLCVRKDRLLQEAIETINGLASLDELSAVVTKLSTGHSGCLPSCPHAKRRSITDSRSLWAFTRLATKVKDVQFAPWYESRLWVQTEHKHLCKEVEDFVTQQVKWLRQQETEVTQEALQVGDCGGIVEDPEGQGVREYQESGSAEHFQAAVRISEDQAVQEVQGAEGAQEQPEQ